MIDLVLELVEWAIEITMGLSRPFYYVAIFVAFCYVAWAAGMIILNTP